MVGMEQIWWSQVINSANYIYEIVENLLEEKSVIVKYSNRIPWRDCFFQQVKELLIQENSEKRFETLFDISNPGEYLLNNKCKAEKRALYRPTKGYASFLAENDDLVIHDIFFWVKITSFKQLENWVDFISSYVKGRGKKNKGTFVLEWSGEEQIKGKKGIKNIDFDVYISEYDRIVFAMLVSASIKGNVRYKNYLTELAVNISGNDIELCAECINNSSEFLRAPVETVQHIVNTQERKDGTSYVFDKSSEEMSHSIWLSQIRVIYPIIEEYREDFVQKYDKVISKFLPIKSTTGEIYSDPKEVEIGTLKFMADNKSIMLNTLEYEKLNRFKNARNKLSHLTILEPEDIEDILS